MLPSTASASRLNTKPKHSKQSQKLVGSIPGGTPLQGLGYLKAKPVVLAKEDDEYPEWLWTLLDAESGVKGTDGKSAADVAGKMAILLYHVTSSPMVLHVLFYCS